MQPNRIGKILIQTEPVYGQPVDQPYRKLLEVAPSTGWYLLLLLLIKIIIRGVVKFNTILLSL